MICLQIDPLQDWELRDLRGFAMQRGHRKRLVNPKQSRGGEVVMQGRTYRTACKKKCEDVFPGRTSFKREARGPRAPARRGACQNDRHHRPGSDNATKKRRSSFCGVPPRLAGSFLDTEATIRRILEDLQPQGFPMYFDSRPEDLGTSRDFDLKFLSQAKVEEPLTSQKSTTPRSCLSDSDRDSSRCSVSEKSGMQLAYILRGFLHQENRQPISNAGAGVSYRQDIRELWHTHSCAIQEFERYYGQVKVFFVTYSDTPRDVLSWARKLGEVILIEPRGSTQFKTLAQGLVQVPEHDAYFVTRTDIRFKHPFYELLRVPSHMTVLNKETHGFTKPDLETSKNEKANDILMLFPHGEREELQRYLDDKVTASVEEKRTRDSAHDMFKKEGWLDYLTESNVPFVRSPNDFYELLGRMITLKERLEEIENEEKDRETERLRLDVGG